MAIDPVAIDAPGDPARGAEVGANAQESQAAATSEPAALMQAAIAAAVAADPNLETATVTLAKDALEFLRVEAAKRGVTTGEMLRISIGTQKFLSEKTAAGAKLQLKDVSGTFDVAI